MTDEARRLSIVKNQVETRDGWNNFYIFNVVLHYVLGVTLVVLSATVAAKPDVLGLNTHQYDFLAFVVAVGTALVTFLKPADRAERFRQACSSLNVALTRYATEENFPLKHVLDAYEKGEKIIHRKDD